MNVEISVLAICVEAIIYWGSYIGYYIICVTVALSKQNISFTSNEDWKKTICQQIVSVAWLTFVITFAQMGKHPYTLHKFSFIYRHKCIYLKPNKSEK